MMGKQFVFTSAGALGNFVNNQAAWGDLKLESVPSLNYPNVKSNPKI
jgi:hypothetical protein